MKILVTGGAGFIGSHIVDTYIAAGHEVLVIDNLSSGKASNLNSKARLEEKDINDPSVFKLISTFAPDVINHQAAQIEVSTSVENPTYDAEINIVGTLSILEAARKTPSVKKVLFASSGGAVYGEAETIPTSESQPTRPISPYGVAKLSVEHYLYYYNQVYGLPYVALRYSNVFGPRQNPHGEAGVIAIFFQRVLAQQEFIINGEGNQTRDFVFVSDVANASLLALDTSYIGSLNISTKVETSLNVLVDKMCLAVDYANPIKHGPAKPGEQMRSCIDFQLAHKEMNWSPKYDLNKGIKLTAEFFKSQV